MLKRRLCRIPLLFPLCIAACGRISEKPELVWGERGTQPGAFVRPRAIAIDKHDHLYIVDFTARVQKFDRDGKYLDCGWATPDYRNGRPSGLSIDLDGNLLVSDSHYHCARTYKDCGEETKVIGGDIGTAPGQLGYISDVVQDREGFYYLAEFTENHRISKFDSTGKFQKCWGSPGMEPNQFGRIRAMVLGPEGNLYVADATNHRIAVYSRDGELVRVFGGPGSDPGKLSYPFDLAFNPNGDLYVVERGNNRVQKFTTKGESLGCWGGPGRQPGKLHDPWALAIDSKGRVHVLDTENNRVQRISF